MADELAALEQRITQRAQRLHQSPDARELADLLAETDALEAALLAQRRELLDQLGAVRKLAEFRNCLAVDEPLPHQLDQTG